MVKPSYPGKEHPIGYVEVQSSWFAVEKTSGDMRAHAQELIAKTIAEQPHLKHYSSLAEHVADGAGRLKVNLYLGFEPKRVSSEPLNPSNLNNAPLPQPGMIEPTEGIVPLGHKEQQFNRGT